MPNKKRSAGRRARGSETPRTAPEPPDRDAFVIMPFRPIENVVFSTVIRPLGTELRYMVTRADTTLNQRAIMQDVIEGIQRADVVIADLTGRNPNVFYELGLAHALSKPVVLLAQSTDDIPFDLGAYRAVIYDVDLPVDDDGAVSVSETLSVELRAVLEAVRSGGIVFSSPFLDYGEPGAPTEPPADEPGVLDQMAEFVGAVPEYQEAMEHVVTLTKDMAGGIQTLSAEMQNPPADMPPIQFALAMTGRAGALWNHYADELEPHVNDRLLPIAARVERSAVAEARAAILSTDRERLVRALEQARTLQETSTGAGESVRGFVRIVRQTAQWGTALRRPADRFAAVLERVVAHFERTASLPDAIEALPGAADLLASEAPEEPPSS